MFEFEPKITEELKELKNVVLAPHVGMQHLKLVMRWLKWLSEIF